MAVLYQSARFVFAFVSKQCFYHVEACRFVFLGMVNVAKKKKKSFKAHRGHQFCLSSEAVQEMLSGLSGWSSGFPVSVDQALAVVGIWELNQQMAG